MAKAGRGRASYRRALKTRNFRWLISALAVSQIGSWAYNVALVAFVYERTSSATWVAAASMGRFIPALLCSTYGGVIAERFERRRLMQVLDTSSALAQFALAAVMWWKGPVLLAILLAASCSLIGTAYAPATAAMTPEIVGEEDLAAANALNSVIDNGSVIIGPGIGAVLLIWFSPALTIVVNAGTFLFSAWALGRMTARSTPTDVTGGGELGVLGQMGVGVRAIFSSTTARTLVLFSVMASFYYGTDTVLMVELSERRLGTGSNGFGYLLAALGVGGILAAPAVNWLAAQARLGLIISVGMLVYTLPSVALVFVTSPQLAFGLEVVRGAGTLVVDVLAVTALQRTLSPDLIARVFGVFWTLVLAAISLGALVTPLLLHAGLDPTLYTYGFSFCVVLVLVYPSLHRMDSAAGVKLALLKDRIGILEALGIFAAASRPVLERLAGATVEQDVPDGTTVIVEGDVADALYVLISGTADVVAATPDGGQRSIYNLLPGEYFGEIGLLQGIARTASVITTSACHLYRIDGGDFTDCLTQAAPSGSFLEAARSRLSVTQPARAFSSTAVPRPS